jgi:hypothetical protein
MAEFLQLSALTVINSTISGNQAVNGGTLLAQASVKWETAVVSTMRDLAAHK